MTRLGGAILLVYGLLATGCLLKEPGRETRPCTSDKRCRPNYICVDDPSGKFASGICVVDTTPDAGPPHQCETAADCVASGTGGDPCADNNITSDVKPVCETALDDTDGPRLCKCVAVVGGHLEPAAPDRSPRQFGVHPASLSGYGCSIETPVGSNRYKLCGGFVQ